MCSQAKSPKGSQSHSQSVVFPGKYSLLCVLVSGLDHIMIATRQSAGGYLYSQEGIGQEPQSCLPIWTVESHKHSLSTGPGGRLSSSQW